MNKFLDVVDQEDPQTKAFFHLALDSGARRGELCALRWDDIDLDTCVVKNRTLVIEGWKVSPRNGPNKERRESRR